MSYKVFTIPPFDKQLKRLAGKYPSLKKEIAELFHSLETNPAQGQSIGDSCYKIRLAIASKGKGKSGGARVISYFIVSHKSVYLISIYDKSEKANISDAELKSLLKILR
jgi:mRNA-degrading endonuclease RelE of RelBE toxin-antitoxin system